MVSSVNGVHELVCTLVLPWSNTPQRFFTSSERSRQRVVGKAYNPISHSLAAFHTQIRRILFSDDGVVWEGVLKDGADQCLSCKVSNYDRIFYQTKNVCRRAKDIPVTGDLSPLTRVSFLISFSKTDEVKAHARRTAAIATFSS
jgi:hypothetical protein